MKKKVLDHIVKCRTSKPTINAFLAEARKVLGPTEDDYIDWGDVLYLSNVEKAFSKPLKEKPVPLGGFVLNRDILEAWIQRLETVVDTGSFKSSPFGLLLESLIIFGPRVNLGNGLGTYKYKWHGDDNIMSTEYPGKPMSPELVIHVAWKDFGSSSADKLLDLAHKVSTFQQDGGLSLKDIAVWVRYYVKPNGD